MGRPHKHGETIYHPSPRYRDKIRLHRGVSGPNDLSWRATFRLAAGGKWTKKPVSLGTTDFEIARDDAIGRLAQLEAGFQPTPIRQKAEAVEEHSIERYGRLAITTLQDLVTHAGRIHEGKEHNFKLLIAYIRSPLIRDLGAMDIRELTEAHLKTWVREFRVKGRKTGQMKRAAPTTIGNIDRALKFIWDEAALKDVVSESRRPIIPRKPPLAKKIERESLDDGDQRAFIDEEGMRAVYRVMSTDAWMEADKTGLRRLIRVYIALLATAGFRPGLELVRTMIGDVRFASQNGSDVILINVRKNMGKNHPLRVTTVYEGSVFPVRYWLKDLIEWRKAQGAMLRDPLFVCGGSGDLRQRIHRGLQKVFADAGVLIEEMTGKERSGYSIRHYFATSLIDRRYSYPQIAAWMGTSEQMIERHYNRYALETKAYEHAGTNDERNQALIDRWHNADISGWASPPDPVYPVQPNLPKKVPEYDW